MNQKTEQYIFIGQDCDLSLRESYAAFALAGILAHDYLLPEEAAKAAYRHADAMLNSESVTNTKET